jgi:SAM-dependent methyltransferase
MNSKTTFSSYKKHTCRICGADGLMEYLNLGNQPPANSFISLDQVKYEKSFPLRVSLCNSCGLSQLQDIVSGNDIFDDYLYLSSTSKALCQHYQGLVNSLLATLTLSDDALVVDIGCNDGVLLKAYPKNKFRILGVDPSSAGEYAIKEGFDVDQSFFNENTAKRLRETYGKADIITATNVFAHVDDIQSFAKGIQQFLCGDGVFIAEFPYLGDMLDGCYFDTIYHEHLSYLSLTPLMTLFSNNGLRAIRVERIELGASGPALRLFVALENSTHHTDETIQSLLAEESSWGVSNLSRYKLFAKHVSEIKKDLLDKISELIKAGYKVGAYCAPAKGNTLLNYLELDTSQIKFVSENNDLKIGKLTPGTHIPIVSDLDFIDAGISHALLLAWNYADFFIKNSDFIKQGGKFLVPLPEPVIYP